MAKIRYCPEENCGRILDRYQHYCSECAQIRRDITMENGVYNYRKKNRVKINEKQLTYHHKTFKSRAYYKELARG